MEIEGKVLEVRLGDCPICGSKDTLKVLQHVHEIPYFGKVMESTVICERCGYRNADVMPLEEKEPKVYTVKVEGDEDLSIRVVRSKSGTVELEEIGVKIEPGPAAEGFVSNVEGLLNRVQSVLMMTKDFGEQEGDEEAVKKIEELLRYLEDVKSGRKVVTVKVSDPFGNSALIGEKVKSHLLSEDEVEKLSKGPYSTLRLTS